MSYFHVVASLAGGGRKTIMNKSEAEVMTGFIVPFVETNTITTKWGGSNKRRQAHELRVYKTETAYDKKAGVAFDDFVKGRKNRYDDMAKKVAGGKGASTLVFVVMPIQGEKYGDQDEQRIYKDYDERFAAIEEVLGELDCYAIRIDKEAPLEGMVERIKQEIRDAQFLIADLTDERPSCYYEAGFADALSKPVIYVASKESVVHPKQDTKIHFDIHRNINFFTNHGELKEKIKNSFQKNKAKLLAKPDQPTVIEPAA